MQTKAADIVFINAKVVKAEGILSGGVAIEGEKIVAVAEDQYLPDGREVIDIGGKYLFPGLIDHHVHLGGRCSFADGVAAESKAAAMGGVTTLGVNGAKCMKLSRNFIYQTGPEHMVSFHKGLPEAIEIAGTESMLVGVIELQYLSGPRATGLAGHDDGEGEGGDEGPPTCGRTVRKVHPPAAGSQ